MEQAFMENIRIVPAFDERDSGGECRPKGLVFELEGVKGRVVWSVNTGWVSQPVLTPALTPGAQERGSTPGVDPYVSHEFPQGYSITVVPAGVTDIEDGIRVERKPLETPLVELLVRHGKDPIFQELRRVYDDFFPGV